MKPQIYYDYYASPVGQLLLLAYRDGLIYIGFEHEHQAMSLQNVAKASTSSGQILEIFCKTKEILDRYFAGEKLNFSQLDFILLQGSDFQQSVWRVLQQIPYGKTMNYGEIAVQLGKPNAMRAVGGAVGRNPISILVPCHRVLGKNQTLTGFGGGLPCKRFLLDLEGIAYKDQGTEFVNPKHKKWSFTE